MLARRSEMLDAAPDDLEALLRETQLQAYARRFTEFSCADIMSRAVVSVTPQTSAQTALRLIDKHHVKTLPVIDAKRRVCGISSRAPTSRRCAVAEASGKAPGAPSSASRADRRPCRPSSPR